MYITRFTRTNGSYEDYAYKGAEAAEKHLLLFGSDDSELYRNISVLDAETNTVLEILPFKDGKPQQVMLLGSLVSLAEEWSAAGERNFVYKITNINESTERVVIELVKPEISGLHPAETVSVDMIEPFFCSEQER